MHHNIEVVTLKYIGKVPFAYKAQNHKTYTFYSGDTLTLPKSHFSRYLQAKKTLFRPSENIQSETTQEPQDTTNAEAEAKNVEAKNVEGENVEGENVEGENAEGENAEGENAEGENAEIANTTQAQEVADPSPRSSADPSPRSSADPSPRVAETHQA